MKLAALTKLIDRLEVMARNAGFDENEAQSLASSCIENAAGVGGVEINIECAVFTMDAYIDEFDLTKASLSEL